MVAVCLVAGFVVGISQEHTTTIQSVVTTTISTTVVTSIQVTTTIQLTTPSTTVQATCTTSGPTLGVVLRVVANNGSWAGVPVTGEAVGYCDGQKEVTNLGPSLTNSSGWVSFLEGGLNGIYYLHVNESAWVYDLSIPAQPTTVTYAVLNLSTGNVTTRFCEFNACR